MPFLLSFLIVSFQMPLVLTLKSTSPLPLEVERLQPTLLCSLALEEINQVTVQVGNRLAPCKEYFEITGSAQNDQELIFRGDCSQLKNIGQKLDGGQIRVEGNAGLHLGAEMKSGEIFVTGDVGDWAGTEMKGGRIHVAGNAADFLGATYRGGRRGMTGGEIFVQGNAGDEIGRSMRRGLIAIGGHSGAATGFNMLAGTILLFGKTGKLIGAGMKRGTIVCFEEEATQNFLPTFLPAAQYHPPFMTQYLYHLRKLGFSFSDRVFSAQFQRYCGDFTETGRGEILVCTS